MIRRIISRLFQRHRDLLLLGLLLCLFVGGIYGIGYLYQQGKDGSYMTAISREEVDHRLRTIPNNTFRIDSVVRLYLDYPVYTFDVVDEQTVILNRPSNEFSGIKLSSLQVDDKQIVDIADNVEYGVVLSPDRKQLLYTQYGEDVYHPRNYMYQLADQSITELKQLPREPLMDVNNNHYLSFDGHDFSLFAATGKGSFTLLQTYNYDEMIRMIANISGYDATDDIFIINDLATVKPEGTEESGLYILAQVGEQHGVYRFSLTNELQIEEVMTSSYVQQFDLYNNGNLLLQGTIGNTTGLYSINLADHSYKLLKEGDIWNYTIDKDHSRIAYLTGKDNRDNELHVAYLEADALVSDTVIYRNIDNLFMLCWYDQYLFTTSYAINQTELYRFTLSGW